MVCNRAGKHGTMEPDPACSISYLSIMDRAEFGIGEIDIFNIPYISIYFLSPIYISTPRRETYLKPTSFPLFHTRKKAGGKKKLIIFLAFFVSLEIGKPMVSYFIKIDF